MDVKRVLVTGATGMLGRAVVPRLVQSGYAVQVLSRSKHVSLSEPGRLEFLYGDVTDMDVCRRATENVNIVIHLAARVHTHTEPGQFRVVNDIGTANLVEAAGQAGAKRFVFISSNAVYGDASGAVFNETCELNPTSPYGQSKVNAETHVRNGYVKHRMTFTIMRPSMIYGEYDRGNMLRMIKAVDRGWFAMIGNGQVKKSMTYVGNVADVISTCLVNTAAINQAFNVSDPSPYELHHVATVIATLLQRPLRTVSIPPAVLNLGALGLETLFGVFHRRSPITRRDIAVLGMDSVSDVSLLENRLGYRSQVLLDEGLRRSVAWYRQLISW